MAPRYIDADDALKLQIDDNTGDLFALGWNRAIAKVATDLPTADVEPVVHAFWVKSTYVPSGTRAYICSRCGRDEPNEELYCNCGAKMDRKW